MIEMLIAGTTAYFVYKKALGRPCQHSEVIQKGFLIDDGTVLLHFVRKDGSWFSYFIACGCPDAVRIYL